MIFVWDEPKRLANFDRHGLDFAGFEAGFSWDRFLSLPTRPSATSGRARFKLLGDYDGVIVVAIVSPLGRDALAIVSVRRANRNERNLYARS